MNLFSYLTGNRRFRLVCTAASVVLMACWGISILNEAPTSSEVNTHISHLELAIAAPASPHVLSPAEAPVAATPDLSKQIGTALLGLIAAGGLSVLAANAFAERLHGCGCVSILAAIGLVALFGALFLAV